jgi:lipopolysaccharide export LptBFGC system permease protein LptF
MSDTKTIQILQAKTGYSVNDGWLFKNASIYTISKNDKKLSTSWVEQTIDDFCIDLSSQLKKQNDAKDLNFIQLIKKITNPDNSNPKLMNTYRIRLYDKLALPFTTIVLVLLGVPLAITPPRVRYNRGFLFSILIIFFYYLIRALSLSFGESGLFLHLLLPGRLILSLES